MHRISASVQKSFSMDRFNGSVHWFESELRFGDAGLFGFVVRFGCSFDCGLAVRFDVSV